MSYARASDASIGLDVTVAAGTITRTAMLDHVREQIADPSWPAGRLSLSDFRLVDSLEITPDDVSAAARLYAPKVHAITNRKTAYLRSPVFRGAAVLEREFARHYGVGPVDFDDLAGACEWLGVDEQVVAAIIARLQRELGVTPPD